MEIGFEEKRVSCFVFLFLLSKANLLSAYLQVHQLISPIQICRVSNELVFASFRILNRKLRINRYWRRACEISENKKNKQEKNDTEGIKK